MAARAGWKVGAVMVGLGIGQGAFACPDVCRGEEAAPCASDGGGVFGAPPRPADTPRTAANHVDGVLRHVVGTVRPRVPSTELILWDLATQGPPPDSLYRDVPGSPAVTTTLPDEVVMGPGLAPRLALIPGVTLAGRWSGERFTLHVDGGPALLQPVVGIPGR